MDDTGVIGFYHRVRPRLVGTLSLLCGDGDTAEELAQETLARVWLRWSRVHELDEPLAIAWTCRVAVNLANSWLRRRIAERRGRARLAVRATGQRGRGPDGLCAGNREVPHQQGADRIAPGRGDAGRRGGRRWPLRSVSSSAAPRDPSADLDPAALQRRVRQLRRRRLASMVAAVALLALLVPLGQAGFERLHEPARVLDRPVTPEPAPTTATTRRTSPAAPRRTPQEVLEALARLPPGWSDFPPPPRPRARAVSLWTGTSLFFWGGDSGNAGAYHADGWLFDPVGRRWHAIFPAPLAGRSLAAAVWTGDEVIVWGGYARGATFNDGAAYDPATGAWRPLPTAPLSQRAPVATVWTGNELIVWGSTSRDGGEVRDGAAFNPHTNRWRMIAPAPLALNHAGWPSPSTVWTGQEMVVVGSRLDENNATTPPWSLYSTGLAYNPVTDAWRELPRIRLSPQASTAVWTGSKILAWDYDLRAATYDPKQDSWRQLPRVPIDSCEAAPDGAATDRMVLAQGCGYALWDTHADKWVKAKRKENRNYGHGRVVAAGSVFLIAGSTHESDANGLVAYSPR